MLVLAIANNFHQANEKKMGNNEERWRTRDLRFVKLNVDATFYIDEGVGATTTAISQLGMKRARS